MLTADNLFDGTISTSTEHFYIEPSHKYSKELPKTGVHSIIYKLSDVKVNANHHHHQHEHEPPCASERLFRKLQKEKENNLLNEKSSRLTNENNVNEKSDPNLNALKLNDGVISSRLSDNHEDKLDVVKRSKRWLSDEEVRLISNAHEH